MENKKKNLFMAMAAVAVVAVAVVALVANNGSQFQGKLPPLTRVTTLDGSKIDPSRLKVDKNALSKLFLVDEVTCTKIRRLEEYNLLAGVSSISAGQVDACKKTYPDLFQVKFADCKTIKKGVAVNPSTVATCNKYYSAFMNGPTEATCKEIKSYFSNNTWSGNNDKKFDSKTVQVCNAFWPEIMFGEDSLFQTWYE